MHRFLMTVVGGLLAATSAQAQGVNLPDVPFEVYEYQQVDLHKAAAEKFALLKEDGFYSAFAIAPDGTYGFSTGNNTLYVAERDALAYCTSFLRDPEMICTLLAVTIPVGHNRADPIYMGNKNRARFREYQGRNGAKAFAANDGRFVGWSYGYGAVEDAEARALQECEKIRKESSGAQTSDVPCKIVDSSQF